MIIEIEQYYLKILNLIDLSFEKVDYIRSRGTIFSLGNGNIVIFRYSKLLRALTYPNYWFGLSKTKFESFPVEKVFVIFICETNDLYFVIPGPTLQAFIEGVETKGLGEWKIQILPRNHSYLLELTGPKYKDINQFMNNYNLLKTSIDQKNVNSGTNNIFNDITKDASQKRPTNLNRYLEYKENMINNLLGKLDSNKDNRNSIGSEKKVEEGIRWYEDKNLSMVEVIHSQKSTHEIQDEQTPDTSTAQKESSDLSQLLVGPQYIPFLTALKREGVVTIEQCRLKFQQISLMRYLNSINLYSWQERVKVAEAVNRILGEEDKKEDLPSTPTVRAKMVATVESMAVDFSENRNYAHTKPTEFSLHGKSVPVQSWADLLVALCNMLMTEEPDVGRTLIDAPLISTSARAYFSTDKNNLVHPKQLSNGMWVETNFDSTDIVEICQRLCQRFGIEINDLTISYHAPGWEQQDQTYQRHTRDQVDNTAVLSVTDIDNSQLEAYLKSRGLSACTIDEMITGTDQLPWMRTAITRAVEANTQIVEIAKGRYIHRSCIVDMDEAGETLLDILRNQFRQFDGYSNYRLLFDAARIDLSLFMNDNAFEDDATIYSLAKHLFLKEGFGGQRYCFYGNTHIWEQEPDYTQSMKGLFIYRARLAGGKISRAECEAFLGRIKMGQGNFNQAIQAAGDSTFIQYDSGEYLLSEALHIDDAWREQIKKALDGLFEENEFAILRDISEIWYHRLPELPLGLPWTPLLLQEVLYYNKTIGYKTISAPLEQARDTVAAAIVTADSDYRTFADVVSAYLCNKMELPRRMGAEDLRLLLRDAGMVNGGELIYNMHKALDDYRFAWSDENRTVYIQKG